MKGGAVESKSTAMNKNELQHIIGEWHLLIYPNTFFLA